MKLKNINKIYIIHWKKLIERKNYLLSNFDSDDLVWVDFFDRETISNEEIEKNYINNKDFWDERVINLYNNPPIFRELRISEICNSLSHIYALNHMINNNVEYGLILEDDVILNSNFFRDFDIFFDKTPSDFDIIFLGSSFSPQILDSVGFENDKPCIDVKSSINVYEKFRNPKTRTVDAYILKNETCKKLKNIVNEISLPYDVDLAYFIKELELKVYWFEPGLVFQGSQCGIYGSSIR